VYPLVYTALCSVVLALAIRRRFGEDSRLLPVCLLPVSVMLSDYLENAGLFTVLLSWPTPSPLAASVAAAGNGTKWILIGLTLPLTAVSLLDTVVQVVRRRTVGR
jgi:hypothetical protein